FPRVHSEILRIIESNQDLARSVSALQFVAAVRPKSPLLLRSAVAALQGGHDSSWRGTWDALAAIRLFVDQFRGEDRALEAVLDDQRGWVSDAVMSAVSLGWPDHPYVERAYQRLQAEGFDNFPREREAVLAVYYARAPVSEVISRIPRDLQ